jgi:hypothetical protein
MSELYRVIWGVVVVIVWWLDIYSLFVLVIALSVLFFFPLHFWESELNIPILSHSIISSNTTGATIGAETSYPSVGTRCLYGVHVTQSLALFVLFYCVSRIKTLFGSSLHPDVCRRAHVLFTIFVFGVQRILCCVLGLLVFVLSTLCCQFLWVVHFWLSLRYSLMVIYVVFFLCFFSLLYCLYFVALRRLIIPMVSSNLHLLSIVCIATYQVYK